MSEQETISPASALYWYPRVQALGTPRTKFVEFDYMDALSMLDGEDPKRFPWGELTAAVEEVGYPVFLRTDQASAKHEGPNAYLVDGPGAIPRCTGLTIEDNAMKDLSPLAMMVREFLPIVHRFTAFRGLPIGYELRVFATAEEVVCAHYYWPEEAIRFWTEAAEPPRWRVLLAAMAFDVLGTQMVLESALQMRAVEAAKLCPAVDAWSVDFALVADDVWYLIDMAPAEWSWHPEHLA